MSVPKPTTVDEYLDAAPEAGRAHLNELRLLLRSVAPKADENIKWGQPVFEQGTILFAYAAHKAHLNFVPTGPALAPFAEELRGFKRAKDSFQIPYDRPLPTDLIRRIAAYRLEEVTERGAKWRY
ncbi:iron chaperone [Lewinella sp. IMCC34191]|uniref:iron chaperone n=1 Tax=Lewinella sp. IMCC34191 TaxID=2259172 RepID=UPI000E235FE5|nr:DUF1801 domain-containing protein [Lewinella sp. IMCC34191]